MMKFLQSASPASPFELKLVGQEYSCRLLANRYASNQALALSLFGAEGSEYEEELITTISTNLNAKPSASNRFWLKNWGEHEGIEKFLMENSIAFATGTYTYSGFVLVDEWELTPFYTRQLTEETSDAEA